MSGCVYVDNRYVGNHGIARYAREVVSRLTVDWLPLRGNYQPGSPMDAFEFQRLRLPHDALLYNPGYTAGPSRARQLLTVHDLTHLRSEGARGRLNRLYYESFVKPAIKKAGHVLTVSETSAREIRAWLGPNVKIHNAGNGCSRVFAEDHGAEDFDRPYFLFVGNFKKHKNPAPLFAAMRSFPEHLLVVVSGDREGASRFAQTHGISDRLIVRCGVDDVALSRLYRGCDALVFPSTWEGFGLPVVEAITAGANVVYCSAAESVAEICAGTQFAVTDPTNSEEFAYSMALAAGPRSERPAGIEQYDWDAVGARVESVIADVWYGHAHEGTYL